jgi:antitoxin ParD1/3/4
MTLHVSLPTELESLVHGQVKSGMYGSASEVVREALRRFFQQEDALSTQEIKWLRTEMARRRARIDSGEDQWVDGEKLFQELETLYS